MLRGPVATVFQLIAAGALCAQQTPITRLRTPDAEFAEPFSQIDGVRALMDGRVIVLDGLELTLHLVDFERGRLLPVGRKGAGPGEYQRPLRLFPWRGDTTALDDMGARRVLLILPNGRPGPSFDPRRAAGGESGMAFLNAPRAVDGMGRMYTAAQPLRRPEPGGEITLADSSAIERWERGARTRDTVAWLLPPSDGSRRFVAGVGVMSSPSLRAFKTEDQWAVASDGGIAIVHWNPYRVDFVGPDGQLRRGAPISYDPIPVSAEHQRKFLLDLERPGIVTTFRNGTVTTHLRKPPPSRDPWEFPDHLPPFLPRAIAFSADGYLWIQRTTAANAPPVYDLINSRGMVDERVELPIGSRVVGFGAGAVYIARVDQDDLQYLQRYRFTPKARP